MNRFDAYEVTGVIVPGSILAGMAAMEVSEFRLLLGTDAASLGGLGLFIIAAFVLGHLVQAFGNLIERFVWFFGEWPTDGVRSKDQRLLSSDQQDQLQTLIGKMEGRERRLEEYSSKDWNAVTARIASKLRNASLSAQVDVANRNYGLFRGITASLILVIAWNIALSETNITLVTVLAVALTAAVLRMRRFGRLYARNLFLSFLNCESIR